MTGSRGSDISDAGNVDAGGQGVSGRSAGAAVNPVDIISAIGVGIGNVGIANADEDPVLDGRGRDEIGRQSNAGDLS